MDSVGAYHAKTHLAQLLDLVAKGEHITITRHGVPVARLVPANEPTTEQRRAAVEELRKFSKGNRLRGLRIKDMINEGRR